MNSPQDEKLRAVVEAFEAADDAYHDAPATIFGSESERKRQLFAHFRRGRKLWERIGLCMYRGCGNTAVPRSHSIHRAGSIEHIAEQQHVLTPVFHDGEMTLKRVGVYDASTFRGFCESHEQLFSSFEQAGKITNHRQIALQAFRSVCREIARKRTDLENIQRAHAEIREARLRHFKTAVEIFPDIKVESLTYEGHAPEERVVSAIEQCKADLKELDDIYDELFQYIETGNPEPCVSALDIRMEFPVSLSGLGVLRYRDDTGEHRALCLLGVLPQEHHSLTFMSAARRHCDAVWVYINKMQFGFGALNAIESWMVNGSDHWFIRPSAWEKIPESRRAKVCAALLSAEYNIGSDADFSILDDARRWMMRYVEKHLSETDDTDAALERLKIEAAKLSD